MWCVFTHSTAPKPGALWQPSLHIGLVDFLLIAVCRFYQSEVQYHVNCFAPWPQLDTTLFVPPIDQSTQQESLYLALCKSSL